MFWTEVLSTFKHLTKSSKTSHTNIWYQREKAIFIYGKFSSRLREMTLYSISIMDKQTDIHKQTFLLTVWCLIVKIFYFILLFFSHIRCFEASKADTTCSFWSVSKVSKQTGSISNSEKVSCCKHCFDLLLITFTCPLTVPLLRNKGFTLA